MTQYEDLVPCLAAPFAASYEAVLLPVYSVEIHLPERKTKGHIPHRFESAYRTQRTASRPRLIVELQLTTNLGRELLAGRLRRSLSKIWRKVRGVLAADRSL